MSPGSKKRKNRIPKSKESKGSFEEELRKPGTEKYVLRLYVAGTTPRSLLAITNIKKICEEYLRGRYDLEVVDVYQQPTLAKGEQIIAAPTLIKKLPLPLRKFIGDMADQERILVGLDLRPKANPEGKTQDTSLEEDL
jgi:circadian clock protein KaiB